MCVHCGATRWYHTVKQPSKVRGTMHISRYSMCQNIIRTLTLAPERSLWHHTLIAMITDAAFRMHHWRKKSFGHIQNASPPMMRSPMAICLHSGTAIVTSWSGTRPNTHTPNSPSSKTKKKNTDNQSSSSTPSPVILNRTEPAVATPVPALPTPIKLKSPSPPPQLGK